MPKVRPIPKRLLIHSVKYQEQGESDGWDTQPGEEYTIDNVRVEPATSFNRAANREEIRAEHILFIDRKHSSYFPDAKEQDHVTFQGKELKVVKVNPQYAFGPDPHHLELELG
ncbi:putative minor capsid protein [Thalassobacillus sp. C254]|uniref:putative minor capsid protein n=1 Tax=Thalassobacillus sp. C254 TaxID=1225341 RepID=UPI0006D1D30D|nr:putative minor capsid protein [Thalassobacillus sp. C254]